jgi:meso-butanediol dehydrogenase/(S,S)-butanediol dehydrogenase/diacetyl reductase
MTRVNGTVPPVPPAPPAPSEVEGSEVEGSEVEGSEAEGSKVEGSQPKDKVLPAPSKVEGGLSTDKVAIVTGAGRRGGIGAAIAARLARKGLTLVIADLCRAPSDPSMPHSGTGQWEQLAALAEELQLQGARVLPLHLDITDVDSIQAMVGQVRETYGRLDILVNNAGAAFGPAPVWQMTDEAWRKTLEVNATGTFLCTKYALPLIIAGGRGGRIINLSSIAAEKPKPYTSAYAASKAAVVALTRSLAQEVAPLGITVNAVLPGDVDTAFKRWALQLESAVTQQAFEDVTAAAVSKIPVGRIGEAVDVAHLVAFLASDEAGFITGQAYNVTGGRELT